MEDARNFKQALNIGFTW